MITFNKIIKYLLFAVLVILIHVVLNPNNEQSFYELIFIFLGLIILYFLLDNFLPEKDNFKPEVVTVTKTQNVTMQRDLNNSETKHNYTDYRGAMLADAGDVPVLPQNYNHEDIKIVSGNTHSVKFLQLRDIKNENEGYRLNPGYYAAGVLSPYYVDFESMDYIGENNYQEWPYSGFNESKPGDSFNLKGGGITGSTGLVGSAGPVGPAGPAGTTGITNAPGANLKDLTYEYELSPEHRKSGILYSGDIIILHYKDSIIQRGTVDSQIIFAPPIKIIGTNLSKLRFVLKNAKSHRFEPVKYGDIVYIKHNIYENNKNESKFIKSGEKLQSHQDGPMYNEFQILDSSNVNNRGYVLLDKEIFLCKNETMDNKKYLSLSEDNSVLCNSLVENASSFKIELIRVYELYNKNLCINADETLYP